MAENAALVAVSARTTPALIAEQLRARIVDGTFPPGMQLGEAALAEQLAVSRGPVREALQRLIQEGLLVNVRNRGVFVVELTDDDIVDIYRARGALEREAATCLRRSKDESSLLALDGVVDDMAARVAAGDLDRLADLDVTFHATLVAAVGSRRLSQLFDTLAAETRICLARLVGAYEDPDDIVAEHRALLDAIRGGTQREVIAAVDGHLASAVRDLTS
jgi:DNA-binding GntR family transcriptional regulator